MKSVHTVESLQSGHTIKWTHSEYGQDEEEWIALLRGQTILEKISKKQTSL